MSAQAKDKLISLPAALVHSKYPRQLLHELHLLAQLLYKANAQFRATKWVQTVRAIDKCAKRIFAHAHRTPSHHRRRRSYQTAHPLLTTGGVFGKVQTRASAVITAAATPERTQASGSTAATTTISLRSAPMGHALWQSSKPTELRKSVQDLIALLRHLSQRATASYSFISAHLSTPPAPTFAPLATALLGVCAQCGQVATAWADSLDSIDWDRSRPQTASADSSAAHPSLSKARPIDTS
ncbi:hypothetical protein OC846_005271 [Tilletia horrida]|uniref:Uncharacterized protein n=1 Tax=Tilletia horrida TaxID=155126 RepID=A0AAN6GKT0_9BASI|nr:hypothetical protein OC846_005271 [Tilletia horrida]KAK0562204.1 hypothetical protein OC861_005438 [Tilletia horrida]